MSSRIEEINIRDLLDGNGNPFSAKQAQSFTEDRWGYELKACRQFLCQLADGHKRSDDEILKKLRPLNTLYRVRAILKAIRLNHSLPMIGVIERGGKLYLKDGRHRCWAMLLAGKDKIRANVITPE